MFSTDNQSGVVLESLYRALLDSNKFEIWVAAEGASLKVWDEARVELLWRGSSTATTENPVDKSLLEDMVGFSMPDVIILGTSSPPKGELVLGRIGNSAGIPVVIFPDTWGAGSRLSDIHPGVVLALDSAEKRIEEEAFPESEVIVVGDPLQEKLKAIQQEIPKEATKYFSDLGRKGRKTILLVGQGVYTTDVIDWVRESLKLSPKWRVVPRVLHPNPGKRPPELANHWERVSQSLPEGSILEVPGTWKTDHLAALADMTVSVFSTVLRVSAFHGKLAVSVSTEKTRAGMKEETGLDHLPLRGVVVKEVYGPCDLDTLALKEDKPPHFTGEARWSPEKAIRAIESII